MEKRELGMAAANQYMVEQVREMAEQLAANCATVEARAEKATDDARRAAVLAEARVAAATRRTELAEARAEKAVATLAEALKLVKPFLIEPYPFPAASTLPIEKALKCYGIPFCEQPTLADLRALRKWFKTARNIAGVKNDNR